MYIFGIGRHVFVGIIFVCHVAGVATITLIINGILVDGNTLHLLLIIKTIIEHDNLSSTCTRFSNSGYAPNFLLGMY